MIGSKEVVSNYNHKKYLEGKEFITRFKEGKPCLDCKDFFPPFCLDFDHRQNKYRNVSQMKHYPKSKLILELNKCDLVCANCHRIRTQKRFHS